MITTLEEARAQVAPRYFAESMTGWRYKVIPGKAWAKTPWKDQWQDAEPVRSTDFDCEGFKRRMGIVETNEDGTPLETAGWTVSKTETAG